MAKVVVITKAYFGNMIRDAGDVLEIPDDLWNDEDRRPSWAVLADEKADPFGGKGDHDGDGKAGGSKPAAEPKKGKGKAKPETVEAQAAEPFADAPQATEVQGNGVAEALGTAPDWIAPGQIVAATE